ncbi:MULTISPECIES: DNA-3-methyladenine glycosylase 2 [unclassified Nocardioides]|uniref:DNA-3-methyladenine glycosylase 2 n=1 Tax=unclassified Nocardioides TaxID=2615069 RepID=UPI0009F0A3BC|nr:MULTISPECIES: DNA-3-methyladenine glycosylase 2 [unclassified Nocardioides]GAW48666.1 DNA-3-methyladenine glycosylase II /transcriptional regulator Ada /DNA-O6-methylguanine--protein-cysteine S-methyltransferase [Nocardioides sp. PD653-B2]GAW54235.1 DNA-3-methyladenine glycosylase II /transcriptional regulator Ada /DNA-O6-methylguanine--protein-cysteine S-methyltransferase [Nocardioides sp. PD653]
MTAATTSIERLDAESCYRAVKSRDRRFDGVFYTAVRTTGIYCRPSCPARTPALQNVTFHPSAASAQAAGYRACKRCLPDATPGSPDWDVAATAAGRAMRLIADGVVDREGVEGLAARVGYTPRHLTRILNGELGAGPLALARAKRAQTARVLIETTELTYADIAFASGFSSIRQFNETIREVYAASPTDLRGRRGVGRPTTGSITMRLAVRTPYAGHALLGFLATRAVPGVEAAGEGWYARTLSLPHGSGTVRLEIPDVTEPGQTAFVTAAFALEDLRDTAAATERVRRMLDADCDPLAVGDAFAGDPVIGPLVRALPGLRVPGHVDGHEIAVRAVLGQQVSVAGARTVAARLVERHGRRVAHPVMGLTHLFPDAATLAGLAPEDLPMPRSRGRALIALCAALASGDLALDRGPDRNDVRRALLEIPGIGPWTADYIALRALGHPDVFLPTDIGIRDALAGLGRDPSSAAELAEGWRPWRSYAQLHLWQTLSTTPGSGPGKES